MHTLSPSLGPCSAREVRQSLQEPIEADFPQVVGLEELQQSLTKRIVAQLRHMLQRFRVYHAKPRDVQLAKALVCNDDLLLGDCAGGGGVGQAQGGE